MPKTWQLWQRVGISVRSHIRQKLSLLIPQRLVDLIPPQNTVFHEYMATKLEKKQQTVIKLCMVLYVQNSCHSVQIATISLNQRS